MSGIELASYTDGPSIVQITGEAGVFTPTEMNCVEELWNAYQSEGEASGYVFLVHREHGGIQGYACFGPHSLTQGTYDLYWIVVDPVAQGCGIGRALLEKVEAEVRTRGGSLLLIETSNRPVYAPAHRFYEMCGYRCEAFIHHFYAPGDSLLVFSKNLEAQSQRQPPVEYQQIVENLSASFPSA